MEANRILLVEDDKEIREGVEIFLKSQNYIVFQAADGVEGLEIFQKKKIFIPGDCRRNDAQNGRNYHGSPVKRKVGYSGDFSSAKFRRK